MKEKADVPRLQTKFFEALMRRFSIRLPKFTSSDPRDEVLTLTFYPLKSFKNVSIASKLHSRRILQQLREFIILQEESNSGL